MLDRRVFIFNLALSILVFLTVKPLWWLPLVPLTVFLLSMPKRLSATSFDWRDWQPILATLSANLLSGKLARWVRYRKIIGGDGLTLVPTLNGTATVLVDLSKNDIDTLLHFIWLRTAFLMKAINLPKGNLLRTLERFHKISDRVEVTYLTLSMDGREVEWQSLGCFGLAWHNKVYNKTMVLPTTAKFYWRTRKLGSNWLMMTDGLTPCMDELSKHLTQNASLERFALSLPAGDDVTIGWLLPDLKLNPRSF